MQVPIKVIVDTDTKEFEITVGTPPASALLKKEASIEKGSGNPKQDNLLGKGLKERVKEIVGTCNSMGILVEGVPAVEAIKLINDGKFDEEIRTEKTELSAEEMEKLEEERKKLAAQAEKRKEKEKYTAMANEIINSMSGKEKGEIRSKLKEAKIPIGIIDELVPAEEAAPAGAAAPGEAKPEGEEKKEES